MDKCSYFIKNRAIFGSYPSQQTVEELERLGVTHFIDLTWEGENNIIKYITKRHYISYPIADRKTPKDWRSFAKFILMLVNIIRELSNDQKIYVHCRGGHGRSGIVVACVLCYLFKMTPADALKLTAKYHGNRKEMREKWRKIGSPQTKTQKYFVNKFFEPLYFYKAYRKGYTAGLSNFSSHPVNVEGLGIFQTAEGAFNAMKDPSNADYVAKQMSAITPTASKYYGLICNLREDWEDVKEGLMFKIIDLKFRQNEQARENLLNTGLRPIIYQSVNDEYWGYGDGTGKNILGIILCRVRNILYTELHVDEYVGEHVETKVGD